MTIRRWFPKSRFGKFCLVPLAILIGLLLATYLLLLSAQAYSAWKVSKTLDRLEALRIGSTEAEFEHAVALCDIEHNGAENIYEITSVAYRSKLLSRLILKLPDELAYRAVDLTHRAGLRFWGVRVLGTIKDGRVQQVSLGLFLVGRYESLGTKWTLTDRVRERFKDDWLAEGDPPTQMHWFHITSVPSGEGYANYVTPRSSDNEYQARRINRKCFFSFRGCDGLCELLPNVARVHGSFGGCTSAPASWCEPDDEVCRKLRSGQWP